MDQSVGEKAILEAPTLPVMGMSRKAVGAAALSVSVVWFLVVVSLSSDWNNRRDNAVTAVPSITGGRGKQQGSSIHHQDININYVSKRRVPNGPDPIHNRRAGDLQLPPT
ncbi:CLAVATA3/ESR (CLE)-related protein 25 [Andrographis paniculata]|uniref:CLAVATA3/ESR (CLE)-related protein 25 n=1 Tax=Andrographis paniculata TaxID=175694 RepID=UPI0021E77853|nr:CLAVATA3/ESR (CLE)-related protein 25 [Andrographis paniculata]